MNWAPKLLGGSTLAVLLVAIVLAQDNPTIESWGRYSYPSFGISFELPDSFPAQSGRTQKRNPISTPSKSNDYLRISSYDSGDRTLRATEFDIELRRIPKGYKATVITEKCASEKEPIPAIPKAWWCTLNPAYNVGDSHQTHMAQIPTPRGRIKVYVFGINIGSNAAVRILKSTQLTANEEKK